MNDSRDADLTHDGFLGGRLTLWQPRTGYRAGVDPVLLAASVSARAGQSVLDLGCGVGTALFCLAVRCPDLDLTGIEVQEDYADLARRNATENGITAQICTADIRDMPPALRQSQFDVVLANPPYFRPGAHSRAQDRGRALAMGEDRTPLVDWVALAARRMAVRGVLHMIQRVERLPELLAACSGRLGSVEVLPLSGRFGRAPDRVILRARKGGRAAFRLHAPLVLHDGQDHARDGEDYTTQIASVLRKAQALDWPVR